MIEVYCVTEPSLKFQWTVEECTESNVIHSMLSDIDRQQEPIAVGACSGQELAALTKLVKRLCAASDDETASYLAALEQPELISQTSTPPWIEEELRGVVPLSPLLQLALYLDMPRISAILSVRLAHKISSIHENSYGVQASVAAVRRLLGIESDFTASEEAELMADNYGVVFIK